LEAMAEDPMEGRSGQKIPEQYGLADPYFRMASLLCVPALVIAVLMSWPSLHGNNIPTSVLRIVSQLAAAYAFGSNGWLLVYGNKMMKVCKENHKWLGKEAFSLIQANNFPEFFALQTGCSLLALGGHVGAVSASGGNSGAVPWRSLSGAALAALGAVLAGAVNLFILGPMTNPRMLALYNSSHTASAGGASEALLPAAELRKKFGMVHGMSMLIDLIALILMGTFIALSANAGES